ADVRSIGNVLVTQFAFIRAESFKEIFGVPGTVNYILVTVDDGVAPDSILQKLADQVPGSSVYTTQQFAARASEKGTGDFLPIIRVILAISFIVGLTVLSLVIYSATIERAREYAIMKVIGASPLGLYHIVISQSMFIAVVRFGSGRAAVRAVDGLSLSVRRGELVLVMGPSGSGKTTLLTLIGGLLRPTSGIVRVNGLEITSLKERQLTKFRRHYLGFIFQSFNLLESLNARENVEAALNFAGVGG